MPGCRRCRTDPAKEAYWRNLLLRWHLPVQNPLRNGGATSRARSPRENSHNALFLNWLRRLTVELRPACDWHFESRSVSERNPLRNRALAPAVKQFVRSSWRENPEQTG